MKVLALVTDAFGGHGGIAKFNRDLLAAVCTAPGVDKVVALPRLIPAGPGKLPAKLEFIAGASGGKVPYTVAVLRAAIENRHARGVLCGHINLLPLAVLARMMLRPLSSGVRPPLILVIHGTDAWQPTSSGLVNRLVRKADVIVAVSEFTRKHFWAWAQPKGARSFILPNCVDLAVFTPGPKSPELLSRHGLEGRTVLVTVCRLSAQERGWKGIDQVIEVLPELAARVPKLSYVVVGDGTDRTRLEEKATALGLRDRVVFTGRISEQEKVAYYRLADAFVLTGRVEGFGIVYLEAMACGIPVVGSKLDASSETLRHGELGIVVNPDDREDLLRGISEALQRPRLVPPQLAVFSVGKFESRCHALIDLMSDSPRAE